MLLPNVSIVPGTRLGPYEVREKIGAGGMGEVYRATDTTLKRDAAIKVLPEEFARDRDRLARFRREAQILASLNHPCIAAIYGFAEVETADGPLYYLAMEYVPGETLGEAVFRRGALPMDDALGIVAQICDALEHAHDRGQDKGQDKWIDKAHEKSQEKLVPVMHRDLKPANVKVTPEGKVKVLDFGLAKAYAPPTWEELPPDERPTMQSSPSIPGAIIGTASYMSPEQARGKPLDKRTDIFSLGVVLFELLTAKQIFTGETVPDILASVMRAEPDWSLLPAETPAFVRGILRRCLQKDREERASSARHRATNPRRASQQGVGHSTTRNVSPASDRIRLPQAHVRHLDLCGNHNAGGGRSRSLDA